MSEILVVNDSYNMRAFVREALETMGHHVFEAENGSVTLEILGREQHIELIISDFNMPQLDGIAFAEKVRDLPGRDRIPFVMLTTESSSEMKMRGKEAKVLAWVTKPLQTDRLISIVAKILKI